jgi:hypothetical protein
MNGVVLLLHHPVRPLTICLTESKVEGWLWHMEMVTDVGAEGDTVVLHNVHHSKETEVDDKTGV